MLFAARAPTKPLAEFLRRMALSLEVGIDIRQVLASEARRCPGTLRQRVASIADDINSGSTLTAAIENTGEYFPALVRELVSVGEQTGHLPEVLQKLAEHYDEQLKLRRVFLGEIAWPMAQLGIALAVIGLLIWVAGFITRTTGNKTDILGFGLTGEKGLAIYLLFLAVLAGGAYVIYRAAAAGKLWVAPLQRFVLRLPVLGTTLRTLAVARFAWTLHMAMGAALEVKRAVALALRSTHNAEFIGRMDGVESVLQRGHPIHEALLEAGVFPIELVHIVEVGEESGRLVETLAIVARQKYEEARAASAVLAKVAGWIVWAVVAGLMIAIIFRLAGTYFGNINRALQMK